MEVNRDRRFLAQLHVNAAFSEDDGDIEAPEGLVDNLTEELQKTDDTIVRFAASAARALETPASIGTASIARVTLDFLTQVEWKEEESFVGQLGWVSNLFPDTRLSVVLDALPSMARRAQFYVQLRAASRRMALTYVRDTLVRAAYLARLSAASDPRASRMTARATTPRSAACDAWPTAAPSWTGRCSRTPSASSNTHGAASRPWYPSHRATPTAC